MLGRFKLDENLPRDAKALIAGAGHDVESAIEEHLAGDPDLRVLDACRSESRVLITLDLDFADIRLYPPASHAGIWVLGAVTQSIQNTLSLLGSGHLNAQLEAGRARGMSTIAPQSNRAHLLRQRRRGRGHPLPQSSGNALTDHTSA
jgi:predicted nuclease of predicted toxin-antitoxin system